MTCREIQEELLTRAGQGLADTDTLKAHVQSCPDCRRFQEVYELAMSMGPLEPSAELDKRILQKARAVPRRPGLPPMGLAFLHWRRLGLAATLILGLMLSVLVWRQATRPGQPGNGQGIAAADGYLRELERAMDEDMFQLEVQLAFLGPENGSKTPPTASEGNGNSGAWQALDAKLMQLEAELYFEMQI